MDADIIFMTIVVCFYLYCIIANALDVPNDYKIDL